MSHTTLYTTVVVMYKQVEDILDVAPFQLKTLLGDNLTWI